MAALVIQQAVSHHVLLIVLAMAVVFPPPVTAAGQILNYEGQQHSLLRAWMHSALHGCMLLALGASHTATSIEMESQVTGVSAASDRSTAAVAFQLLSPEPPTFARTPGTAVSYPHEAHVHE